MSRKGKAELCATGVASASGNAATRSGEARWSLRSSVRSPRARNSPQRISPSFTPPGLRLRPERQLPEHQVAIEELLAEPDAKRTQRATEPIHHGVVQEVHRGGARERLEDLPLAARLPAGLHHFGLPFDEGVRLEVRRQEVKAALLVHGR